MSTGKVLIIYTGGTIGMLPSDPGNMSSPLKPAPWKEVSKHVPLMQNLIVEEGNLDMEPMDSAKMNPDHWVEIARAIESNYANYDGFVILHGTDTMTYTASALSFLLENLGKPVVLTGAQLPIALPRSDAIQNLVTSLVIASPERSGLPLVPEVCIFFNNVLLRGNRSRKISSSSYMGFHSPNCDELGRAGDHVEINRKLVRGQSGKGFFINETLEKNVLMFDIFPGLDPGILKNLFDIKGLKGLVLKTYGAGNAPTDDAFLKTIEYAVNKEISVVNVTQCNQGMVQMGRYDAGANLLRLGVISGSDMTPEAALVKLKFLLGLGYDMETVREFMQKNLRGEQSADLHNFMFGKGMACPVFKTPPKPFPSGFQTDGIDSVTIRIDGVKSENPADKIEIAIFLDYPKAADTIGLTEAACLAIPQCLGITKEITSDAPVNVIMDCTSRFDRVAKQKLPIRLWIVSRTNRAVEWEDASVSVYAKAG